ncbi:beta-carotene 15,15'-monooxygenase [Alloscardovia theropitheci]|uniref:Beta-carotene 15,15'-monooxygenase n=1 Tax=Alloscardovia theropitheci TaxID=2496842 RepID=A0A4R0QRU8_9BIFI|nr:DUF6020 family protein [Alloscardovia theropitheci]TCD53785.1 beta-carotene 15,15'-monooxygenase [Alloscardovia theropitheci]
MSASTTSATHKIAWGNIAAWALAALASAWVALCTSVGPIYRRDHSIATFGIGNAILFAITWILCMTVIWLLVRLCQPQSGILHFLTQRWHHLHPKLNKKWNAFKLQHKRFNNRLRAFTSWWHKIRQYILVMTNSWWKIALILLTFWTIQFILVPTIFAADLMSQYAEMTRWTTSLNGTYVSYADTFNVVDIYPIAHYMWPDTPTYLTNQHNVVLTFIYGATLIWSQRNTGTIDLGLVILSFTQMVFAIFCVSVTLNRFFTFGRPLRIYNRSHSHLKNSEASIAWRVVILLFFILNPQVLYSTTALTKSPLFAFAFLWWFGQWYEIFSRRDRTHIPRSLIVGIVVSTAVMLSSAKYATYIIAVQIVLIFIADRKRWRAYLISLVIPFIIFQGALTIAVNTGSIISGDPIESRGIQLQQIARVMRDDPSSVSEEVRSELRPIFNLYTMGATYSPDDADRVKSSGSDGKVETYKWETVTQEDMANFNKAWLSLGLTHPTIYVDAFLAKVYGYFDVNDTPYVSTSYYLSNSRISNAPILRYWVPQVRQIEQLFSNTIGEIPILGWLMHGNFYVVCVLLLGCAVIILRRWKDLLRYSPLILLMGVMIMAPANNFERHMLPLSFVAILMLLHFVRTARLTYARYRISKVM